MLNKESGGNVDDKCFIKVTSSTTLKDHSKSISFCNSEKVYNHIKIKNFFRIDKKLFKLFLKKL